MDAGKVLGIVVTYNPVSEGLLPLLQSLESQVETLLIIDNTPSDDDRITGIVGDLESKHPDLRMLRVGHNIGIAAAQNIGLEVALEECFDYVLISDQDSLPDTDMVSVLRTACLRMDAEGVSVGCICPMYFDRVTQQAFAFQVQRPGSVFYSSVFPDEASPCVEIIATISSGMLIPCAALRKVGSMRESFFIDHVDTEWCHRARAMGFRLFGTSSTRLLHRLGDASFRVWYFGWHSHSEYSPTRLYYRFRNFVLLCRLPHVPLRWRLRAAWYWTGNLYAHTLFAHARFANAKAIARGLRDGITGKAGRLDS
ncbi:MAG: glycosyltransferase family 2 protein [Gammaproteobacteria bacterium]|nr:glycosyltransferase family 2 protein [Gammaproteobacteria bacterium]